MNMNDHAAICMALAAIALSVPAPASAADNDKIDNHQQNALIDPSSNQMLRESRGPIYTVDGMTDKTVDKATDNQPELIKSKMFADTKKSDEDGNPLRDVETRQILVADDDC